MRASGWLEALGQDVRFGARTLRGSPLFATTAILTLALATGATTAIFSVVNGVVLRPLPFPDPGRLVQLHGRDWREDRGGPPDRLTGPVAAPELDAFETQSTMFEGFAAYEASTRHLDGPAGPERLNAVLADVSLFALLGVQPVAGRAFAPGDGVDVAVIGERLWRERFNRSPETIGTTVRLDGRACTIVGVMPGDFQFPYRAASLLPGALRESRTDVWLPLEPVHPAGAPLRRGRLNVIARLKPGVTLERGAAELRVIATRVEREDPAGKLRIGVRLVPLADAVSGPVRRSLWMLFAAVGLVLAAACANVANLLLARMPVRAREVVTRAALGAGGLRLARQFLAESLLLSLAGGLGGVAIAWWGTRLLVTLGSARIPRAHEVALDWQAFAFLLLACVVTALLFGLAPALTAARADVRGIANDPGARSTIGPGYRTLRDALVVGEVALAFVLGVGAALVIREIARLERVDPGMTTANVIVLHVTPRAPASDYYAIEDRVSRIPGVHAAGFIQMVPLQNWGWEADFTIRGRAQDGPRRVTELRYVTPGYFAALGIPIVRGRGLSSGDTADAPHVVLVNEALARRYFANDDPIGRELDRGTIVGVVGDVRNVRLDRPAQPELYYPAAQNITMTSDLGMSLVVRTDGPAEPMVPAVRGAVRAVAPSLAIFNVKSMDQVVADSLWELRVYRWLIGLFAALTLLLAAIGLHGVISYTATSRSREFAIRLALGVRPGALARLVVTRALTLVTAGLSAGIVATLLLRPVARTLPLGGAPDAATCAAISVVLIAIALIACTVPALRAAAVDPVSALRHE